MVKRFYENGMTVNDLKVLLERAIEQGYGDAHIQVQADADSIDENYRQIDERIAVTADQTVQGFGHCKRPAGCLKSSHYNGRIDDHHQRHN